MRDQKPCPGAPTSSHHCRSMNHINRLVLQWTCARASLFDELIGNVE